ncbi:MAG: phosphoribosylglycinamide formyltransferase 1 [Actinomycetota bacterium]|jgi:phosphoribosylglycinamide formyltransferase-1|nr:phosphoribosylglycinamide formyltransferase 1 [Actinomycetota bacterium]
MGDGPLRIAGIASHNGTNLRHIDAAGRAGTLDAELVVLVSNNGEATILDYARDHGIAWCHLSSRTHPDPDELDRAIAGVLREHGVDLVFLSGYMRRLGPATVGAFRNRILNIHPALLPAYGGEGMYGDRVYQAVLAAGETETGPSVHLVDEEYDHGPVVLQYRVAVLAGDTLETLRDRVRRCEPGLALDVLGLVARGEVDLDAIAGGTVGAVAPSPG